MRQKQGNTEAVPVGNKSNGVTLVLFLLYHNYLIFVKCIRNVVFIHTKIQSTKEKARHVAKHTGSDED